MKQGGLLQAQGRYWFHNYDVFRTIPKEMAEATPGGIAMTVVACLTCITLFLCEVSAFLTATPQTHIVIDSNQDELLRINFDVHMLDLACEHVTVGVWDAFGVDRRNITRNLQKQRIDHKGKEKGHIYTEDELVELEFTGKTYTAEELSELDADWSSSSDQFKHDDFQSVVEAHDFTFVNFYADWCGHCRQFSSTWAQFDAAVNSENASFLDADGVKANVRVLKINCVDFEETCQNQKVHSFPTVRFYRRAAKVGEHSEYSGPRTVDALSAFAKGEVAKRHLHSGATFHEIFTEGCRVSGFLEVARVPGTVHFEAVHPKDKNLNLAYTNVSHHVHHFSFGEAPRRSMASLPQQYKNHVNPIDGRTFVADRFHMAPQHYIKVVHTRFESIRDIRSYQQTHQWSVRSVGRKVVPQAKFSFDLAPVEVVITKGERRWYDFVCSLFAIIGGTYSSIALAHGVAKLSLSPILSLLK
jgi:thiol-disulfide isomerase/thioredoxin